MNSSDPLTAVLDVSPDSSRRYLSMFERYVARTDSKERLGQAIAQIARERAAQSLLDLGAGNGTLTRMLAPSFQTIIAVDKNKEVEFFFLEHSAAYRASRRAFTGVLRSMTEPLPGGSVGIRVAEGLLRVVRKHERSRAEVDPP